MFSEQILDEISPFFAGADLIPISTGPEKVVARVRDRGQIVSVYPHGSAYGRNARHALTTVARAGVSEVVAPLLDSGEDLPTSFGPVDLLVSMDLGSVSTSSIAAGGRGLDEMGRGLAGLLGRLHGVRGPAFSRRLVGDTKCATWPAFVSSLIERMPDRYRELTGAEMTPVVTAAVRWLERLVGEPAVAAIPPALTHRDVWLSNVFMSEHGRLMLIDLDLAGWSDPVMDLVKIRLLHGGSEPGLWRAMREAYRNRLTCSDEEFEHRLEICTVLEGIWGLPYHLRQETDVREIWIGVVETAAKKVSP